MSGALGVPAFNDGALNAPAGAYGGTRRVGEKPRGLLSHPIVRYSLPAALATAFLFSWLGISGRRGGKKCGKKGAKKEATWSGPIPASGEEMKMTFVVNDSLKMSAGKTAAQVAHAAVGLVDKVRARTSSLLPLLLTIFVLALSRWFSTRPVRSCASGTRPC